LRYRELDLEIKALCSEGRTHSRKGKSFSYSVPTVIASSLFAVHLFRKSKAVYSKIKRVKALLVIKKQ
jgi:hypothetical protein